MFSTKERLIKRTGKHGIGRFAFLQQLVQEYQKTKSREAKEQVLANLANFAYDPVNYDYLWRLKVLDLFFSALEENNTTLITYGIGGICNICLEPLSREYILRNHGIKIISSLLSSQEETVILSAITTLIYLDTPNSRGDITCPENIKLILALSESSNTRIKNLAIIFLKDLCNIDTGPRFANTSKTSSDIKSDSKNKTESTQPIASTSAAP